MTEEKNYLVIYGWHNEYTCGCCRREHTDYEIFATYEETEDFCLKYKLHEDLAYDQEGNYLIGIYKITEITEKFKNEWCKK